MVRRENMRENGGVHMFGWCLGGGAFAGGGGGWGRIVFSPSLHFVKKIGMKVGLR